jgi:hypothetical protein
MDPIKLQYSEPFIRDAMRAYWWKQTGPGFLIALISLATFFSYKVFSGERDWFVGVLGAVLLLGLMTIAATYFVHLHRLLGRLRRMKVPEGLLELGEERFKVTSDVGSSEIEWSLVRVIWRFEKVWLLFFSAGEFMTLPTAEMTEDAREFIVRRAEANGAKVA